jgi:hypothetical protein
VEGARAEITEEQTKAVIKETLFSSHEDINEEDKEKKPDDLA